MLAPEKVDEIKLLLGEKKLSQRKIAKLTGVSRVVIHRIATGKRNVQNVTKQPEWDADRYKRPFERCPVCGGLVQLPCIACIVKSLRNDNSYRYDKGTTLGLELEDDHRKRYLQVKAWRERQENPNFEETPENWPFWKMKEYKKQ